MYLPGTLHTPEGTTGLPQEGPGHSSLGSDDAQFGYTLEFWEGVGGAFKALGVEVAFKAK